MNDWDHDFDPVPLHKVMLWGVATFVLIALLALCWPSRAADPRPDVPPTVEAVQPRAPVPARQERGPSGDGPMCLAIPDDGEPATLLGALLEEPANEEESLTVSRQVETCFRGRTRDADPFMLLALHRFERDLGATPGILAAVWCGEAALRLTYQGKPIRGDYLDGYAGAWGPLQLHSWAEDRDKCGLTTDGRDDLFASAACWWSRVLVRASSDFVTRLHCKDPFPLAEAMVSDQGKYAAAGCRARSEHWTQLGLWGKGK